MHAEHFQQEQQQEVHQKGGGPGEYIPEELGDGIFCWLCEERTELTMAQLLPEGDGVLDGPLLQHRFFHGFPHGFKVHGFRIPFGVVRWPGLWGAFPPGGTGQDHRKYPG